MKLPNIKNAKNLKGKRVLVRTDFNALGANGKIEDMFRIKKSLSTINFLKKQKAKIILISHLSKGTNKSLKPIANYLKKHFKKLKLQLLMI